MYLRSSDEGDGSFAPDYLFLVVHSRLGWKLFPKIVTGVRQSIR